MSPHEVVLNGIHYPTGEHAFYGEKFRVIGNDSYSKTFQSPSKYTSPAAARKAGGKDDCLLNAAELSLFGMRSLKILYSRINMSV